MKLSIPIKETIQKRHSIRTYEDKKLTKKDKEKLMAYMDTLCNPFGVDVKIHIIDKGLNANGEKLGTYGVIKGANTFLGVSIPNTEFAPVAAGYEFENLILYATAMGLGTVWLAATFSRDSFASAMGIGKEELFPAVSPVGYPASKKSIKESIMRKTMKSSTRKAWNQLFYEEDFQTPLTENAAGAYAQPLEIVRLAPSAKNVQPWRVLKVGNIYHFYETHNQDVSKGEAMIKQVDLGIALSHFHQTLLEEGLKGKFEKLSQDNIKIPANTYYIVSWIAE